MTKLYYTYRIRISNRNQVQIEVRDSNNNLEGEPSGQFSYVANQQEISKFQKLARTGKLTPSEIKKFGELLFSVLFDRGLQRDFFGWYEECRKKGMLLRIELDVDENSIPEIAALPWELMRISPRSGYGNVWLSTAPNLILSRRRSRWIAPDPIQLKPNEHLRIAIVVSAPSGLGTVKYDKIVEAIRSLAKEQADRIELLEVVESANTANIDAILEQKPHIFHFIGHARFRSKNQQEIGEIALTDSTDRPMWIDADRFSELFNRHQPSVVLLQACEGAVRSTSEAFVGVASQIVEQNIPAVVAMQHEISNNSARHFSLEFYHRLAKNDPVDKAMQEGRRAIALKPIGYEAIDFATPVLFMRVQAGNLFQREYDETTSTSIQLEDYRKELIERLKGDWFDQFINLFMLPIRLRTNVGRNNNENEKQYTIFEVAEKFSGKPIAILGESGAGKTTLVKMLAIQYAQSGLQIPVFVSLGMCTGQNDVIGMFNLPVDRDQQVEMLERGNLLIIFDGLNEVSRDLKDYATRSIALLINKYPNNTFFITCRTSEYPTYLRAETRRFEVRRMRQENVREYLYEVLGDKIAERIYDSLSPRIKDLCRNPLLLTMLTYLYVNQKELGEIPDTKSEIYEMFLDNLHNREESLRAMELSQATREEFLGYLALKMNNQQVSVKRGVAEKWLSELYRRRYQGAGIYITTVQHEVLELPPMKASRPGRQARVDISFMHQSFQEYYAAYELLSRYNQQIITINDLTKYAIPANDNWWESVTLLVGMVDDATELIRGIKKRAEVVANSHADQRTFTLVARCIREAKYVDPYEVDDVIIRTLLAFKFGKVPFDYDLIFGLKLIRPEQRSSDFPPRLIEDVNWWLDKYARVSAVKLDKSISINILISFLDSEDESLVIDSLLTIREHPDRGKALFSLMEKVQHTNGAVREQIIATIGYLEKYAAPAVDYLIDVIQNPEETKWARGYAINALGKIGEARIAPVLINYMMDHKNPYRDGASWSLQSVIKQNIDNRGLVKQAKKAYIQALLSETNDIEGRYAKGNIVYSLGELKASEYINEIVDWLDNETDPYVLEDGVHAVGQLENIKALDVVVKHLQHTDPVVRMMAVDALVLIAKTSDQNIDILKYLSQLQNDNVMLVREAVERVI